MSEHNEDFISFERALRELKMQSEELKKLVSEGEIRAFRDGQSMKFKREDVEGLARDRGGELTFAQSLEDDTGMVTEELTDEETLLAEDDLLDDEPEVVVSPRQRGAAVGGQRRVRVEVEEETTEPAWVTGVAIASAIVLLYGLMVVYNIASEHTPSGLTSLFAKS